MARCPRGRKTGQIGREERVGPVARDERAEPRELEDLGGAPALDAAARLDAPHEADRARLLRDAAVAVVRAGLVGGLRA